MAAENTMTGDRGVAFVAAASATLMIAWQVGAKAARDAIFLTSFDVERLPLMVIGGALLSLAAIPPATRWMTRLSPGRFVPRAYLASGLVTLAIWGTYLAAPRVAAVLLYLQVASMGALLVSGFWSVVNEAFDPRSGKRYFVWITRAATLGGLLGSVLADRAAEWFSLASFLPMLAAIHLCTAALVSRLNPGQETDPEASRHERGGLEVLKSRPYLRSLALLVVVITTGAGILDYVFKAGVTEHYSGADLLQFFAWFYMAVGLAAVLLQALVAPPLLKLLGVGRMAAVLPLTVAIGGIGALLVPGLASSAGLRGVEQALRSSTHRLAYELLYVPVSKRDKRRIKAIIDVGMDRVGDMLGAVVVSGALLIFLTPRTALLLTVLGLTLLAAWIASRLDRGYLDALERSLRSQAGVGAGPVPDHPTRSLVSRVFVSAELTDMDVAVVRELVGVPSARGGSVVQAQPADAIARQVAALRSGDAAQVRGALRASLSPELIGHVIPLLAWDAIANAAIRALSDAQPRPTGQLVDALLDPRRPFAVRRRVPRALGPDDGARGASGLVAGLSDPRFEVRYRCGQALARLRHALPSVHISRHDVLAAVFAEARTARPVWESRTLIDDADDSPLGDSVPVQAGSAPRHTDRSMRHVFTLLSLVLPSESLGIAFDGLQASDPRMRGTALEYLEKVLPADVRKVLWPFLDPEQSPPHAPRPVGEVLDELTRSHRELLLDVERLRRLAATEE